MKKPYLSIVLASRNDDYAGGIHPRVQLCVSSLLEQAERHGLALELILVDWNPPLGRHPLKEALSWPDHSDFCTVRAIEVPPSIHQRFIFSDKVPLLAHRARNVGIRRARGKFIFPTGTDILFSDALIEFLASEQLKADRMYRVERYDVPEDVMQLPSLKARLDYCEQNVLHIHTQTKRFWIDGLRALHTGAAGDFTLLSRELWFKLQGIPEENDFHGFKFDGVLCYMAHAAGAKEEILTTPLRIYHIEHEETTWKVKKSWLERMCLRYTPRRFAPKLASLARRIAPPKSRFDILRVPRISGQEYNSLVRDILEGRRHFVYNDDTWGLAQDKLPESVVVSAKWDN